MSNPIPGVQVAALARGVAHIPDKDLVTMVAISMRESHWDADAVNHNTNGTVDHGLWQINRPTLTPSLFDPTANAKAAGALYASRGLEPWTFGTTHGPSTWRAYLPQARQAVSLAGDTPPDIVGAVAGVDWSKALHGVGSDLPGITSTLDALKAIAGAVVLAVQFLTSPATWLRLGEGIAGAILVLVALYFIFTSTRTGQQVASDAKSAATVAAVA